MKSKNKRNDIIKHGLSDIPPPLSLTNAVGSIQVVDANGDWLVSWKQNFEA
eukprot:CAMPEP_0194435224 /NCGR_PEP_ID=MMETSP0176-20130528/87341_1 /TAXON_ID=216777 /ORGANISM="Proboscia alata, Strain PI-D3" /LENGTH=50 /DNA_ID=CAMNT_0039254257 /DNA_START=66 /DNA_END=214 /DNA_ORIENTATION=-